MCATSSSAPPAPVTIVSKPRARPSLAVARPTANSGSLRAGHSSACDLSARRPLRLVAISACTPSRSNSSPSSNDTAEQRLHRRLMPMLLQRRPELERIGLRTGDEEAHQAERAEEIRPRFGQQLGRRILGHRHAGLWPALAPRFVALAAVGSEDHAAKHQAVGRSQLRQAGDGRAAGAVELGEERALDGHGQRRRLDGLWAPAAAPSPRRRRGSRRRLRPGPRPAASPRPARPR